MPPKKRVNTFEETDKRKSKKKKTVAKDDADSDSDPDSPGSQSDSENGVDSDQSASDDEANHEEEIVVEAPSTSGEVLFCGGTNWDVIGRRGAPKGVKDAGGENLYSPHRIESLSGIPIHTVATGCSSCHCLAISKAGKVYSWGRNEKAQLGHGDTSRRNQPALIESLEDYNIVRVATGKNHTLCLSDRGVVYAFGENHMGQLGLGQQCQYVPSPTPIKNKGPPFRKLACGGDFSMIADVNGNLYSFGCPEYGQLGHNTDGKYFVTSNKLTFSCETLPRRINIFIEKTRDGHIQPVVDVEIEEVACGLNHTVAMDKKKRLFTWGFGGYGRLGHAETKDEMVPRKVPLFDGPSKGATMIAAGSAFTLAVNEWGCLYMWGQQKTTGEAVMYPKPVQDLAGWKMQCITAANKSIVVVADDGVVSWGPSPTYGELGYGEGVKSSTTPREVKLLNDVHIHKVGCGYAHTLYIARNDSEEEKARLEKFPLYDE